MLLQSQVSGGALNGRPAHHSLIQSRAAKLPQTDCCLILNSYPVFNSHFNDFIPWLALYESPMSGKHQSEHLLGIIYKKKGVFLVKGLTLL